MKKLIPISMLSLLLFSHCKTVKYAPDKLPARQFIFGDGGGFAGIETSWTLLENGQIFKKIGTGGTIEELSSLKKEEVKDLFTKISTLQLYKLDIEKPGNLYYFMQDISASLDSRVTWGAGDYLPPQSLVTVFTELKSLVKDRPLAKSGKAAAAKTAEEEKKKTEEENTKW